PRRGRPRPARPSRRTRRRARGSRRCGGCGRYGASWALLRFGRIEVRVGADVPEAGPQVEVGGEARELRIPVSDRLRDRAVLVRGALEARGVVVGEPADALQVGAHTVQGALEVGIAEARVDRLVESCDERVVGLELAALDETGGVGELLGEFGEDRGV